MTPSRATRIVTSNITTFMNMKSMIAFGGEVANCTSDSDWGILILLSKFQNAGYPTLLSSNVKNHDSFEWTIVSSELYVIMTHLIK